MTVHLLYFGLQAPSETYWLFWDIRLFLLGWSIAMSVQWFFVNWQGVTMSELISVFNSLGLTQNEKCRHGQLPSSQSLFNVSSSRERSITIVLTPHTIIMTFLALSLAASLAYLSLPSKPLPAAALNNGIGKLPCKHCDQ